MNGPCSPCGGPAIRVLLADAHVLMREGLQSLIENEPDLTVVGTAGDGVAAVRKAEECQPDVVLIDLAMPEMGGAEATRMIKSHNPEVQVLVLTCVFDAQNVRSALDSGAVGYLLKDTTPHELYEGIRAVLRGESPLDSRAAGAMLRSRRPEHPSTELTGREQEVLRYVARGLANKQIAQLLDITEGTVKAHLGRIFQRLGVMERTSAAAWASRHLPGQPHGQESRRNN
jgi:DNA-binding NarL/FixJ family response regulator